MSIFYPKISIITPSYNQGEYIEETIKSVIDQGYPNTEFIIIDGGSTDGTVDVVNKYKDKIDIFISESDEGQSNAINKGFKLATGEWIAWQNSDDLYLGSPFFKVAEIASSTNADLIYGNNCFVDNFSNLIKEYVIPPVDKCSSVLLKNMPFVNQSCFWKRSVFDCIGYLDESLEFAFDYDFFLRIVFNNFSIKKDESIVGCLRIHENTKTNKIQDVCARETADVAARYVNYIDCKNVIWSRMKRKVSVGLHCCRVGQYRYLMKKVSKIFR